MFGIFDIDTYNIGTSQGLRCSGHLRCSNFARKSNFAKLAMFDFKRTIAKKAELRKIPRPSRSSNLRKGVFAPSGLPKPLPLGEVALRSNDGEGKPGTKEHPHSDKHWLLIESSYRCVFVLSQHPCPLRRSAPAPPKGEPFSAQNLRESPQNLREWQLHRGGGVL